MRKMLLAMVISSAFLCVATSSCAEEGGDIYRPLEWQDIWIASDKMQVPFSVMVLHLHHENGYVGLASPNTNGTYDYGPFQVNSVHLESPQFRAAGITADMLQYDGPTNALAAAWVFRSVWAESDTIYEAIGRYHSRTPKYKARYQEAFVRRMESFPGLQTVIEQANRGSEQLAAQKEGER